MTTTNEHTERAELIKGLRDLAEIDFDNLFMRAAAMLEAQPAAIKPWQIMPTVKDRATNRELPVVGVYEDVVFVDVPAADDKAGGEPVTGRDLFIAWWDGYGIQPGIECSLPVWNCQDKEIQSAWDYVASRYYTTQPAQPAREWVSVTESLPENNVELLVAFESISIPSTGQYTGSKSDIDGWCYPSENDGSCDDGSNPRVTHWMPLPDVPTRNAGQPAADDKAMTPEQINEVNESLWAELDDIKEKTGYNAYKEANRGVGHWTLLGYLLNLKHKADDKDGEEPVAFAVPTSHAAQDGSMEDGPEYLEWADEASDYEKRIGTKLYTHPQPQAEAVSPDKAQNFYLAVCNFLVWIGREGIVHADDPIIDQLSNALHDIDGGVFKDSLKWPQAEVRVPEKKK